ncbi:MAG: AAA family ATPase [Aliarcobacter sp.]
MRRNKVTIARKYILKLILAFLVLATQNPIESKKGVYLPEAQQWLCLKL